MEFPRSNRLRRIAMALALCGAALPAQGDEVEIHVERFGACNAYRPGDMTGLRLRLRSDLPDPTSAIVQWEVENADGDVASYWREVTLPPAQNVSRWLYAKLPPSSASALASHIFTVRVFEADQGRRVRPLGAMRFTPAQAEEASLPIEASQDVIAIVGDGRMGLDDLSAVPPSFAFVPSMNSLTLAARGVSPADFPDRWEGLWSFNEVVWSQASPQLLAGDRAAALREWISRGGSLVIALPSSGNPWSIGGGAAHFLTDLLPAKGVVQVDGVPVEALLPALSRATELRRENMRVPIYVFDPKSLSAPWKTLVALPDLGAFPAAGEILKWNGRGSIVARRSFGHGSITLIGVDIDTLHRGGFAAESLPQVDIFWNRILGRRADAMSVNDFQRLQEHKPPRLAIARQYDEYDCGQGELVSGQIGLQGRAAGGVLATLGLFVFYWLLACPVAWLALRRKKLERLSWMVFAGVSLLASAVAYGIGGMLGTASTELRHMTVLDAIGDAAPATAANATPVRASVWLSALLPGFGQSEVAMAPEAGPRNVLATWSPPPSGSGLRFPDTARFDQPVDDPARIALPSRATTSDFEARWMGTLPAAWGSLPVPVEGKPVAATATTSSRNLISLGGSLTHRLPAALKNVTLIHVSPFRFATPKWNGDAKLSLKPSAPLPNAGRLMVLNGDWNPGQEIDLATTLYPNGPVDPGKMDPGSLTRELLDRYQRPLLKNSQRTLGARNGDAFGTGRWQNEMEMLSLYQMLEPPAYQMNPPDAPTPVRVTRELGRSIDLSRWLTQPCLIVMGTLESVASPVPFTLKGAAPASRGDVLVRFVIPLPEDPALFAFPLPVP